MAASAMTICTLGAFAVLAGVAVYEALVRAFAPLPRVAVRGDARREGERARAIGRDALVRLLGVASETLERLVPSARSDADECRSRLSRAGVSLQPEAWRCLRVLAAVFGTCTAACVSLACGLFPSAAGIAFAAFGLAAGWLGPRAALWAAERNRRRAIEASLPDAMELLGIAVAAGSPLEQCFKEVAASVEGPLSEELSLVDQEVNLLGHGREKALEHLARRCRSQDVSAFVAQLIQAVSQGSSIAEGLASQAALSREVAQASALERIRKMPTKLDVVLSVCFLPPTVALVVVPTVVSLLSFLNDTMA